MDEGEVPRAGTTQIMRVYRYLQSIGIDQPTLDQVQQLTEQAGWEASLQDVTVALHNELREESPEPEGRQQGDATQSGDVSAPEMDASEAFPSLGQMSGQKEGTPLSQKTSQPITRRKTLAVGGGGGEMVRGIQPQGAGQGQGGEESRGAVELDNGVIVPNAKIDELAEREGTTWGQMAEILRRDALQRGTA